jgi:hypothetical protein
MGLAAFGTFTPGSSQSVAVTFPVEFATTPKVFAVVRSSTSNLFTAVTVSGWSTTDCTLNLTRTSGPGGVNVDWLASSKET